MRVQTAATSDDTVRLPVITGGGALPADPAARDLQGLAVLVDMANEPDALALVPGLGQRPVDPPERPRRARHVPSVALPAASHRRAPRMRNMRHRVFVVFCMTVTVAVLYLIQRFAWPHTARPRTELEWAWSFGSLLWLSAVLPAACELTGLMMHRHPRTHRKAEPIQQFVCWRIVSRGLNTEALTATILRCRAESRKLPLFRYSIEVITDTSHEGLPEPADDLSYIRVPADYRTPNGTRNKARALEYACRHSSLADEVWIVHCDEESHPTASGIRGIAAMIAEEEASGQLRIGQGTIVYHRDWKNHPFFTLSDCIRTGSDLGRLYLSMRAGVPFFGLHGSYIVVRNDVEKKVGFDLGPRGSLAEDAWWGCVQMQTGRRCRWVEGYLEEQCTQSMKDFMKQRQRWFCGLVKVALHAPVKLRWRVMVGISMVAWALAPLAWAYTISHFVFGGYVDPWIRMLANGAFAVYVTTTLVGLRINLSEHGVKSGPKRFGWCVAWLCLMPLFSLMESAAVAYAILKPTSTFHVVKK
jgi:beta-1,4-mannosyltransferase